MSALYSRGAINLRGAVGETRTKQPFPFKISYLGIVPTFKNFGA